MTDAVLDGPLPEPKRVPGLYRWVRHHPWLSTVAVVAVLAGGGWFAYRSFVATPLLVLGGVASDILVSAMVSHRNPRTMCPECATVMLDPQAALTKNRWKLRVGHLLLDVFSCTLGAPITLLHRYLHKRWGDDRVTWRGLDEEKATVGAAIVFMVMMAAIILLVFLVMNLSVGRHELPLGWMILVLIFGVSGYFNLVHNRLRLWCPFCKDWGDDDEVHDLTPDPDPADVIDPSLVEA